MFFPFGCMLRGLVLVRFLTALHSSFFSSLSPTNTRAKAIINNPAKRGNLFDLFFFLFCFPFFMQFQLSRQVVNFGIDPFDPIEG